jgi:hypothetical protein
METLKFIIKIKASRETVWTVLWGEETYKQWTNVFCEGTYVETTWNEGDKIYFLNPNGEGMNSIIEKKIPNEFMAFKHISGLKDFKEMPIDAETEEWTGAMETYRLTEENGFTILEVNIDTLEKYIDYFKTTFPNGLEVLKKLSEEKS